MRAQAKLLDCIFLLDVGPPNVPSPVPHLASTCTFTLFILNNWVTSKIVSET